MFSSSQLREEFHYYRIALATLSSFEVRRLASANCGNGTLIGGASLFLRLAIPTAYPGSTPA